MMDVKDTKATAGASITSMLVQNAIAKNQEMKELLTKPSREDETQKVNKADDSSRASADATADKDNAQADPNVGQLVNVNV